MRLGQRKIMTLIEALVNVFSGMLIAFTLSQLAAYFEPQIQTYIWVEFKWDVGTKSNLFMTVMLTWVSMVRGYCWRRFFNKIHEKEIREKLKIKGKTYGM